MSRAGNSGRGRVPAVRPAEGPRFGRQRHAVGGGPEAEQMGDAREWDEFWAVVERGAWAEARFRVAGVVAGWRFARQALLYVADAEADEQMAAFESALEILVEVLEQDPVDRDLARAATGDFLGFVRAWSGRG